MSKNLLQRIIVALIGIPLILWICRESGYWLQGFLLLVTALGSYEYFRVVFRNRELSGMRHPLALLSWALSLAVAYVSLFVGIEESLGALALALLLVGMLQALGKEEPRVLFTELCESCWGLFYVSALYPFIYHVREFPAGAGFSGALSKGIENALNNITGSTTEIGFNWLVTLLAVIWISDTAAMWVGKLLGKRKLAPSVSPNKTIAGFVGGLVSACLIGFGSKALLFPHEAVLPVIGAALIVSLVGQLGDLVESLWKRSVGVKDSSAIIPGHGGVLDRFDSLAFAAPALYVYLLWLS